MISIQCQACGKKLNVPEDKIGHQGKCPACGQTISLNIVNEPGPAQPTGTERRLRKLERQNRLLWGALVVVLIVACIGPFIGGSEPAVQANVTAVVVPVKNVVQEKSDVPVEPVEAKPVPRKAVEKFDTLVANELNIVDEKGRLRFVISAKPVNGKNDVAVIFGYRRDGTPAYTLAIDDKTVEEGFISVKGEGRVVITVKDQISAIYHRTENGTTRLSTGIIGTSPYRGFHDSDGKMIEANGLPIREN